MLKVVKLIALCIVVFGCNSAELYAQKDSTQSKSSSIVDQALIGPRILSARSEFNKGNVRGALTIYREILETEPNNSNALFGVSECQYELKRYKLALDYLDKAVAIDPKISSRSNLYYGQIYHRTANLDDAIKHYRMYQAGLKPNGYDYQLAEKYIQECEFAKVLMKSPVDVSIYNLGEEVNSRYDDYAPSIAADGKTLVFTARRIDTKGGQMDTHGDYRYFEDVYMTKWNQKEQKWERAASVEGELNTETHDGVLSIFPDGSGMYVYKNTVNVTGDIYYSLYDESTHLWQAPIKMPRPINTSYFESSISMTSDGNTIYFVSERPEGSGQGDIYVSKKVGNTWSTPKNLGAVINTEHDEKFVFIHPNGRTLFFASDGHQTMGSYDIFKSELINDVWSKPINLGYPINTVNEESTFSLTRDNKMLIIAAEYDDSFGERDLYSIDVSRYPLISSGYDTSTYAQMEISFLDLKGKSIRGAEVEVWDGAGSSVAQGKTNKFGVLKVNLPGNKEYKVSIRHKGFTDEKLVNLPLNGPESQALPVAFRLNK